MTKQKEFIKKALEQCFIYEKRNIGEFTIIETLPVHWFGGLYTYRRVRLSDGTLVEEPMDLDEKEFNKTLFISI